MYVVISMYIRVYRHCRIIRQFVLRRPRVTSIHCNRPGHYKQLTASHNNQSQAYAMMGAATWLGTLDALNINVVLLMCAYLNEFDVNHE